LYICHKCCCKIYDNEKIFETPAVAINLLILIKDVGNLLITECIKQEDTERKKLIEDFLKLLTDGRTSINTIITETQLMHKRHTKLQFHWKILRLYII